MSDETLDARMERLLRTLPPSLRGVGFGDPDDVEYAHASEVVAWAIREIDQLRDERRWIPVAEKLPELYVEVIGWHPGDRVRSWCRHGGVTVFGKAWESWMPTDRECDDCTVQQPTHWRPLPSPPASE
jgi:hypothetical protein